jgi:hypothetical protein
MEKKLMATGAEQEPESAGQWLKEQPEQSCGGSADNARPVREEVAPGEWDSFVANFTRHHETCPVTVEQVGPDMTRRVQAANRPLAGIVVIPKDSPRAIIICLASGNSTTASSCVAVTAGRRIWAKRNEDGADEALEIEATDGTVTFLHLRPPTGEGRALEVR